MGFTFADEGAADTKGAVEDDLLHRLQCKACPLDRLREPRTPHMKPTGPIDAEVYFLGEAPTGVDDKEGEPFQGEGAALLRSNVPRAHKKSIRYNNVVRTHPPRGRTPEHIEIECCRPSVVADIELVKPKAIFGFGPVPLHWVSGFSSITLWRGRRMPVKIGKHECWFYPMLQPEYLLRQRKGKDKSIPSEEERMFRMDLRRAFEELDDLPPVKIPTREEVTGNIEVISSCDAKALRRLEVLLGAAARAPAIGIDYETHRIRPYEKDAKVLSAAVSTADSTFAFPFDHPEAKWSPAHRADLQKLWIAFLAKAQGKKISHNLAFELEWTGVHFGKELIRAGEWEDTQSQACILDERTGKVKPGCFSLEWLILQHFGFNIKKMSKVNRSDLINVPLKDVLPYNGLDARGHLWLYGKQRKLIEKLGLQEAYRLALRRVPTVILSQIKGAPVDQPTVKVLCEKYEDRIATAEAKIAETKLAKEFRRIYGTTFNPQSNADVLRVFHEMLKCKEVNIVDRKQHKERLSTDASVLEAIAKREPLAQMILDLRAANKLKSTYLDPLRTGSPILYGDGLLHCQFNTTFAETGRLSCEGPNLQNWPKRDGEAKEVRRPVKAPPGHVILAFDYGQIEARVIAMFTKDKRFCKALWERYDIHMEWAERLARAYPARIGGKKNLTDKKVMKDFRGDVKNQWTFPLFFGAQLSSAANYLSIPEEYIEDEFEAFWRQFSGAKEWQEETLQFYRDNGYVECMTGRRRRGPMSQNQVFNSPVQGTAAEIVLDAMSRLSETGDPELQPEINIHDDLTFLRVPVERVETITEKVVGHMLDVPFEWARIVPIEAEMSVGEDWEHMEEAAKFSSDRWFGQKPPAFIK